MIYFDAGIIYFDAEKIISVYLLIKSLPDTDKRGLTLGKRDCLEMAKYC